MRLDISIDMSNAAFCDGTADEVIRILDGITIDLAKLGSTEGISKYHRTLIDFDGNSVGKAEMKPNLT